MNKKDVLELKRRLKKNDCTFTRMSGCYVNAHKETILSFSQNFLNLEDEEFYKYLEIAKKVLSGTIGNNLLEYEFPLEQEAPGGKQQFLMGLRADGLNNDELTSRLYEQIIDSYEYVGNYLILLFYAVYDVLTRTTDNDNLDESEEAYEYLICAICPVDLSKPGLSYLDDEKRIGPRIRDWVVSAPDTAFLFPAFNDRSTDVHSCLFYTKNTKEPHTEFMTNGLGCGAIRTATEQKMAFTTIVRNALGADREDTEDLILDIQQNLSDMIDEYDETHDDDEVFVLDKNTMGKLLEASDIPEEKVTKIEKGVEEAFGDQLPPAEHILDAKAVAANSIRLEKMALEDQVGVLTTQLQDKTEELDHYISETKTYDVVLRVKPEKASQIHSKEIDGKKCIVIPMEENEHATINGVNTNI